MKAKIYGALFLQKLVTFMDTIFNFCKTSNYQTSVQHKTFLMNSTYIYMQKEPFFLKHVFLFCVTLNIFSQHGSFIHNIFFCVSHNCCATLTSMSNIFFVDTTFFCATQYFFVLPNESIKNIVNKEKHV